MAERFTVYPAGSAGVLLSANDHLATGGEGSVYVKGDLVYKVYLEPAKALKAGMDRKLAALTTLRHPGIAAPHTALLNKNGEFIGLVLPLVRGEALCRAFTTGWRDQNQFGLSETARVVDAMRDITEFAHQRQALMVDANEMNWLVQGTQPTAIDVDSWALPGFGATAIMPSIRDYSQAGFSEGSDWFAWAVVTFNLWTGIHPFKGTHPDFARGALEARMRAQASVFDGKVRLPGATRPVADIPARLRDWYAHTFSTSERTAPPLALGSAVAPQTAPKVKILQSLSGSLRMDRLGNASGRVLAAFNGFTVAKAAGGLRLGDAVARSDLPQASSEDLAALLKGQAAVLRTPFGRVLVVLDLASGRVTAQVLETGMRAEMATQGDKLWQSGNRLFVQVPGAASGLVEFDAAKLGERVVLAVRRQWPVAVRSTQFFRGVLVQDCLGTPFIGVLEGEGLLQGPAPALKGYRVAEGFGADRHNVWLAGVRRSDGETVRLHLAYKVDRYAVVSEEVVPTLALDAAVNAAGVAVLRDGADLLVTKGLVQKRFERAGLSDTLRLFSLGAAGIGGFEDSEVLKLSLS